MALVYLDVDIQPYEDRLLEACNEARKIAKSKYPDWIIAKAGLPEMPSVKGKPAKNDAWLPRAIAKEEGYPKDHPWWTVCSDYALMDAEATLALFKRQRELLKEQGLWEIYLERLKVLPVAYEIESRGMTLSRSRLEELQERLIEESTESEKICVRLSEGHLDKLPRSGASNALRTTLFDYFKLESSRTTDKGAPSLDKYALDDWVATLPQKSKERLFIQELRKFRKRQTGLSYLQSYQKFWLEKVLNQGESYVLYPSLNPTGTDTLRWSSQSPNAQQISKQDDVNLRYCFGPAPGREWWSLDAKNLELRIPAYEAEESEMIELFEREEEPPYYGSYHLLVFSILHPRDFEKYGAECKSRFVATKYQWVKNGNFAVQYGAVEQSGTADRAYHVPGAQKRIQGRFKRIARLNQYWIKYAEEHGYVETIPDKSVDPRRGYPLQCKRSKWGKILPTVPFNYHVQGTACWWMARAMVKVQSYLDRLNQKSSGGYYMNMQVHDEVVLDFPKGKVRTSLSSGEDGVWCENLARVRKIARLMESCGDDIGVKTPVGIEYHPDNWSEGVSV
jgi:DNA polymerase I-like protein with 3'-5' exonuclease and polymerase domains